MPLVDVTSTVWGMEYSIHDCPKRHSREIQTIFPDVDHSDMLIVPTCQRSDVDLVQMGEKVDVEKDRLLERFVDFAKGVTDKLIAQGLWCDYIDPCSGLPMVHREYGNVYAEVEGLCVLLGYKTANAGCCKIILHPQWGSSVYPATIFAKAPLAALHAAIQQTEQELKAAAA